MSDFFEHSWERLASLWRKPEGKALSREEKKILREQFEIRQALRGLEGRRYDVERAWREVRPRRGSRGWMLTFGKYAAVLVLGFALAYFFVRPGEEKKVEVARGEEIKPGKLQAELHLATGERLALNEYQGVYSRVDTESEIVNDTVSGKVSYRVNEADEMNALAFNTLVVPQGGEYTLELPDGTIVWVNSQSSLRFPEKFAADRREVFLEGEAYFEVKKDARRPFHVRTEAGNVRVLGTSFNVCAYPEDRFWQTTLVKGAVLVKRGVKEVVMKPNEQYQVDRKTGECVLQEVLPDLYTSWRDGKFYFKAYTFEELVGKLERWYDFTMFYTSESIKTRRFSGVVNKHEPLENMLKFLEMTSDVQFSVRGDVVTASLKNMK